MDIRQDGLLVRRETWVYNGSSFEQLNWQTFTYNDAGCQTSQQFSNGTSTSSNWDGDLETTSTDVDGLTTRYEYDSMGRLTATTRDGVGAVPAQRTAYTYDGDNRIIATGVVPRWRRTALSLPNQYDTRRSWLVSDTSSSGVTTTTAMQTARQVVTQTTAPGTPAEATQTTHALCRWRGPEHYGQRRRGNQSLHTFNFEWGWSPLPHGHRWFGRHAHPDEHS